MARKNLNGQERPDPRLVAARLGEMITMGLDPKSANVWIRSVLEEEPLFDDRGNLRMVYDQFGVRSQARLGYHVEDVEEFYRYHFESGRRHCDPDD